MRTFKVTIQGVSPLLMHRFSMEGADQPGKRRTGVPEWKNEAEKAIYRDEQGTIYQPASHIEATLREAAKSFKMVGKRGASYARLVSSTVDVHPDAIPHKKTAWEVDARPVVVQRARVVRYRPRFDEWELDFTLNCQDDQLSPDILKQVLDYAGLYIGIGDFRPATKGKFGKFMVTLFQEMRAESAG